jgi:hypothetical protein
VTLVPDRYRAVSVAELDGGLSEPALRAVLVGRPAYRRTVYVVAHAGGGTAVLQVRRREPAPLMSEIVDLEVLAGPSETAYLVLPDVDVAVPSALARAAAAHAPGARCVVVLGRYEHVSFILDPAPVRVHVLDVVPPSPPKLVDQVCRVLEVADDLPPVQPVPVVVDIADLARQAPSDHYLLPCRGAGTRLPGATVSYLDQVPPRAEWTLLGCARSQAIHGFFYPGPVPTVDTCPKTLAAGRPIGDGEVLMTKCCLRETGVGVEGGAVVVPWGASAAEILDGLRLAVRAAGLTAGQVPTVQP